MAVEVFIAATLSSCMQFVGGFKNQASTASKTPVMYYAYIYVV